MTEHRKISRREFVIATAAASGGMSICLLGLGAEVAPSERGRWAHAAAPGAVELSPWIVISPDDTVLVRVSTPESGNGALTQIAMTVTEELRCDWNRVKTEHISINRDFRERHVYASVGGIAATFAGRSTLPERMKLLLQVGASARERLKAAAAERWHVPVSEIEAQNSVLTHRPSGRRLRFGEVAASAAAIRLQTEPAPKPPGQWTLLGKASPSKMNNPLIVNGSAVYGIDVRLPGMLYAALMQSPVHGGKLKHCNFDAIRKMPGVRGIAIVDPDEPRKPVKSLFTSGENAAQSAVAVVADHYWQARKALEALPVEWDDRSGAQWKTTEQIYSAALATLEHAGEKVEKSEGTAMKVLEQSARLVEATYLTPFCDQAPIEPLNGTARVTGSRVDVWHPAAITAQAFLTAAEEAGVGPQSTFFNQTFVGGSFGRRLFADDVRLVVAIAKKFPGRPVQVIWSREEAMRQGRYRDLTAARFKASLGKNGLPEALLVRVCRGGFELRGIADCAYTNLGTIANVHIESQSLPLHILTGAYRAPTYNSLAFFMESFIDECAAAAGMDPLEYRLRLLANWPDPGWRKCLQEVAAKSGWGRKLPKGQGQGIAISNWDMGGQPRAGTTVAAVATVEVTSAGELAIQQLDLSFDCGQVLNRDAVLAQLQGGMIFGLNMSRNEELTVKDGRIVEGNFDQYPMLRMADTPRNVNVHFGALSGHERITEVGEPPVGPIGPAVANAIFRATGKRIRTMPFRKHDLRWTHS
jgi:isoquinoline 1-oxidoreductase subunit beta